MSYKFDTMGILVLAILARPMAVRTRLVQSAGIAPGVFEQGEFKHGETGASVEWQRELSVPRRSVTQSDDVQSVELAESEADSTGIYGFKAPDRSIG